MSFPLQAMPTIHNGLDALRHHHYQKAEQVFQTLGEQGNAHAMYWLGNTYQLEGGMKRLDAGEIFLKAANMGDPWAMYRLYTKNPYSLCTVWPCSSKWDSKAAAIWERQSKQGNGKATFALALRKARTFWYNVTIWIPGMGQEKLNKMALKAFHQGYQGAAVYLFNHDKSKYIKYIIQSSENGFKPAYNILSTYYESKKDIKSMNKYKHISVHLGDMKFIRYLFISYLHGWGGYEKNLDRAYYYGKISTLYGEDLSIYYDKHGLNKYRLDEKISNERKELLSKKAKEFVRTHPPYHYYDEFSFPFYVMRFQ
ncbi:SEL1-like repeat protein [Celerinatantimonas diazotrophica]|nr:sel1 repeat family protein [Celerinatantimonas diazotrophica]